VKRFGFAYGTHSDHAGSGAFPGLMAATMSDGGTCRNDNDSRVRNEAGATCRRAVVPPVKVNGHDLDFPRQIEKMRLGVSSTLLLVAESRNSDAAHRRSRRTCWSWAAQRASPTPRTKIDKPTTVNRRFP
jgi:hypothetical protein